MNKEFAIPKEEWPKGPWDGEPDEHSFMYKDVQCYMLRNRFGAWCGYIQINDSDEIDEYFFDVHYGITFNGESRNKDLDKEGMRWMGFDCHHYMDEVPIDDLELYRYIYKKSPLKDEREFAKRIIEIQQSKFSSIIKKTYKDMNFVIAECKSMVDQYLEKMEDE